MVMLTVSIMPMAHPLEPQWCLRFKLYITKDILSNVSQSTLWVVWVIEKLMLVVVYPCIYLCFFFCDQITHNVKGKYEHALTLHPIHDLISLMFLLFIHPQGEMSASPQCFAVLTHLLKGLAQGRLVLALEVTTTKPTWQLFNSSHSILEWLYLILLFLIPSYSFLKLYYYIKNTTRSLKKSHNIFF